MAFDRKTESLLRQIVEVAQVVGSDDVDAALRRLEHLQRALAPEDEFSLLLGWLGRCSLVHRLGQEQLPLRSTETYRVPDLLAAFQRDGSDLAVLIEVKTTDAATVEELNSTKLSLKPHYRRYAELLGMPMLIAWRHAGVWTLFDFDVALRAHTNYRIDFETALKENLLGELAGDFSYRVEPGTRLRMRIKKIGSPNAETGGFDGVIQEAHFVNSRGERTPDIPHLMTLFMLWENDVELTDLGEEVIHDFVITESNRAEFASKSLSQIIHALAGLQRTAVNWRAIVHDSEHLAHDSDRLRLLLEEGAKHGIISRIFRQVPAHKPSFLRPS